MSDDDKIVMDVPNDIDMIQFRLMDGSIVRIDGLNHLRTNRDVVATFQKSDKVKEIVITGKVIANV